MTIRYYFEDFPVGASRTFATRRVTREEVLEFAREFDPQPMHLDEAVAAQSMLGGIAASGWHTCGMLMRMIWDGFLFETAGMGSPGLDEVRWLKPVKPGDELTASYTVLDARPSQSRPEMGICRVLYELTNQVGVAVMTWECINLLARRPAEARS